MKDKDSWLAFYPLAGMAACRSVQQGFKVSIDDDVSSSNVNLKQLIAKCTLSILVTLNIHVANGNGFSSSSIGSCALCVSSIIFMTSCHGSIPVFN